MDKFLKKEYRNCSGCIIADKCSFVEFDYVEDAKILVIGDYPRVGFTQKNFWDTKDGIMLKSILLYHKIESPIQYVSSIGCALTKDLGVSSNKMVNLAVNCSSSFSETFLNNYDWIITLGNGAAKALTGLSAVSKLRVGPPKTYGEHRAKVIHTVSPASCLANEKNYPFLVNDIGKMVNCPDSAPKEVSYKIITSENDALAYLSSFKKGDKVTLDIETDTEKDLAFSNPAQYEMLCIGLKKNNEKVHVLNRYCLTDAVYKKLEKVVNNGKLIAQNGKFDTLGLRPRTGKLNIWFDVMLASYTFDERSGVHSLKYQAQEYLGAEKWEEEVQAIVGTSKKFGTVADDVLFKYNAYDVEYTYRLYKMYSTMLKKDKEANKQFKFLISAMNLLGDIEHYGFKIDHKLIKQTLIEYTDRLDVLDNNIVEFVVQNIGALDEKLGFNSRSSKQILSAFSLFGVKLASTDVSQLTKVMEYGDEMPENAKILAQKILEYRQLQKLTSTYVSGLDKKQYNGRIHANFSLHGTTTGRLSCNNPNLQNIPRSSVVKTFFVAGEGNKLIHADYSQAELRVLSWLAKDTYFRDILNDPSRDIFDELVPTIFQGVVKEETDPKKYKELRTMIKTYVYGLAYGRTADGIAKGFGIDRSVAQDHMNRFFEVIPEIISWQKSIKRASASMNLPPTAFGRRRRFNLRTSRNASSIDNESLAFLPQSTASDITLLSAININNDDRFTGKIVNLVHDDIIAESPEADAERNLELIQYWMKTSAELVTENWVNFETDGSIADRWSDL